METRRTSGLTQGNSNYTYQTGIMDFYDTFGVDRQPGEFLTPSISETDTGTFRKRNNTFNELKVNYTFSAIDDEDEEEDDELDVDELDLDEEDDDMDDEVADEDMEPDLDITEEDEENDIL